MKEKILAIALCASFYGFSSADLPSDKNEHFFVDNYENVLGTSLEIKIAAADDGQAAKGETTALDEIERLNKVLSGYDLNSEFRRWMNAPKAPQKI